MSDPTLQNINPALIPLDWSFYATDSSIVFKLEPNAFQPYWVEAHAHFGRFNSLPLSITMTSHKEGLEDGTALLERILKELLQRRLPDFFNRSGPPAGLELQPSIYYFGIHVQMDAIAFDSPLIKHMPRRARAQIEKVLSIIPSDDLTNIADDFPAADSSVDPAPVSAVNVTAPAAIAQPAPLPTAKPQPVVAPVAEAIPAVETAPAPKTTKKRTKKAKTNPAPSPGFTAAAPASQPSSRVIQPSLVSVTAPAASAPAATAVMTAPVPVAAGAAWDWEEDDDDIVF